MHVDNTNVFVGFNISIMMKQCHFSSLIPRAAERGEGKGERDGKSARNTFFSRLGLLAIDLMEIRFLSSAQGDSLFNLLIDHRAMRPIPIYSNC